MQKQLLTIAIVGVVIIGAVTVGGYYLGKVIQKPNVSPTPSEIPLIVEPTATPEPVFSPTIAPSEPSLLPTAPPATNTLPREQVSGSNNVNNTPTTANTGSMTKDISIRFVGVPTQTRSGQSFTVAWFVDGPAEIMGSNTRLSSDFNTSRSSGSSSASSSSSTSQSFGAFQIPQKFQTNVTFSGNSGPIMLKATAEVNGKTYTATQTVQLTD